ncbi:MAG: hypothetical protein R3E44_16225 [Paracoccaceae bacterium]
MSQTDGPAPEYFKGRYLIVGTVDAEPPRLVHDQLRLDVDGDELVVSSCKSGAGRLRRGTGFEVPNVYEGDIGDWDVFCEFHNDSSNYPVLLCLSQTGARLTLWSMQDGSADTLLGCGA